MRRLHAANFLKGFIRRSNSYETLDGKTVGFISNGKEGTIGFFSHLGQMLKEDYGVSDVILRVKSNYSAPADAAIVNEISRWDAVISGVGD